MTDAKPSATLLNRE